MSENANSNGERAADPPKRCHGCGLGRAADPEDPAPHETTFCFLERTDVSVRYRCNTCETMTGVPIDPPETVSCRTCEKEIPEDLQGNHVCEWHPLGEAADQRGNPMEDHR